MRLLQLFAALASAASTTMILPADRRADVPSIGSLSPTSAVLGTGPIRLTVNGSNFTRTSVVRWNGADRVTTYVSATQLQADIPPSDLTATGTPQVTVFNQGGNGGVSNTATFTVGNPVPSVASIAPTTAALGGEPFNLIVTGSNFVPGASVRWNGAARPTTFESSSRLSANIPASDLVTQGTVQVTVYNPAPLGGSSSALALPVAIATPAITSLSPASRLVISRGDLVVRVNGQNFVRNGSVVRWNNSPRATTWVSPTQLDATILGSDTDTTGAARVSVAVSVNGATRESVAATFDIVNPAPTITDVWPRYVPVGQDAYVTVRGTFVGGVTRATVNGKPVGTSDAYGSMRLSLWRSDLDSVGRSIRVDITTPAPGGGATTTTLTVSSPQPYISSLTPTTLSRGGSAFTLTVKGGQFLTGAVVRWNGSDRPTTFVSATELRAAIPSTDLTTGGSAKITAINRAPNLGPSDPKEVTVYETMIKVPD